MSSVLRNLPCGGHILDIQKNPGVLMYYSTVSKEYPIFTSLGILGWLKVRIYVFVWITFWIFLMVILLKSMIPCFPNAALIPSDVAKGSSLLLITLFGMINFWCGYALHFENIFGKPLAVHLQKQIAISSLFDSLKGCSTWNNLLY